MTSSDNSKSVTPDNTKPRSLIATGALSLIIVIAAAIVWSGLIIANIELFNWVSQ